MVQLPPPSSFSPPFSLLLLTSGLFVAEEKMERLGEWIKVQNRMEKRGGREYTGKKEKEKRRGGKEKKDRIQVN